MPSQAERRNATRVAIVAAARALFGTRGFAQVTVDDVAAHAGVTKGGLYHHFKSKEALFADVLEAEQEQLARTVGQGASSDIVQAFADAVRDYLLAAAAPITNQILLIDGPAVLGWARWREIDHRVFGRTVRQAVWLCRGDAAVAREVDALSNLLMGAIMEGAMICASAEDPEKSALEVAAGLRLLMLGLISQPTEDLA